MNMARRVFVLGCLILLLTACGGSDSKEPADTVWNESEIVDHLGLVQNRGGMSWTYRTDDGTRCNIAIVLTSASQVRLYKGAGDTVATTPGETAGVKIVDRERKTCLESITDALEDLE